MLLLYFMRARGCEELAKIEALWRHNLEFLPRGEEGRLWNTQMFFLKIMAGNTLHVEIFEHRA